MKQVVIQGGRVQVLQVPPPPVAARAIQVRVSRSAISAGTELAGVQAAAMPLVRRALKQPEKIRRALQMVRERGFAETLERVRGTAAVQALGYSAAGRIIAVGEEVAAFAVGDRVACAGAGTANHAEVISVPVNLAVPVPAAVGDDAAATVALGAIALQGVRRAAPTIGETFIVVGLGLIGQLTAQMLRANGCRTIGVDPDAQRLVAASAAGLDAAIRPDAADFATQVTQLTQARGADGVIVTAASRGDDVLRQAMQACRRKGRVVVVGDVGLGLAREAFYAKELDLLVSTSYGPGRYDPAYEFEGADYPIAYVRWTENRNMAAYLELVASGQLSLAKLSTRTWTLDDAPQAYAELNGAGPKPLVALLRYAGNGGVPAPRVELRAPRASSGKIRIALVGAGSFVQSMHLPNLAQMKADFEVRAVMSRTGTTARRVAERAGAAYATSDFAQVLADAEVDLIMIATRHDLHAELALAALGAGKHVFVEKPLATTPAQLDALEAFFRGRASAPMLLTGFNRRFSPAARAAREILAGRRSPAIVNYRVNAGFIPSDNWVHGPEGGGRNIGEACHFYDLFNYLIGAPYRAVSVAALAPGSSRFRRDDNFVATIRYEEGSLCTLTYSALGASEFPKETMDIFADGRVLSLEDFRSLKVWGGAGAGWQGAPDKGHAAELAALKSGLRSGRWPIPLAEQVAATRLSFEVQARLHAPASDAPGSD